MTFEVNWDKGLDMLEKAWNIKGNERTYPRSHIGRVGKIAKLYNEAKTDKSIPKRIVDEIRFIYYEISDEDAEWWLSRS